MAGDSEDLVLSISADVRQMQRALSRLTGDTAKATSQIERQFDAMGSRTANTFSQTSTQVVRSLGAQRAAAQNLGFQLNDIATQLASGTSPFRVLAQQSGQVVQALNQAGGGMGAIRALGGAFAGLVNPVGLATLAIGGLAAVAFDYFTSTEEKAEDTKKKLDEHVTSIRNVVKAWGDSAPPALVEYVDQIERLANQKDRLKALADAQTGLLQQNKDATAEVVAETEKLFGIYDNFPKLKAPIGEAREVLKGLSEDGKISSEEAELLIAALEKLTIPGAKKLIDDINGIKNELVSATDAASNLGKTLNDLKSGLSPLGQLGAITSEGGQFGVSGSGFGFRGQQPTVSRPSTFPELVLLPKTDLNRAVQLAAARDSISKIESGGNYRAMGPVTGTGDRAFGKYQVMGANIAEWSKKALGVALTSDQFLNNPQFQDKIFDHIFSGYIDKFGMEGASQAWFGGPGAVGKTGRQDQLGTSVGSYGSQFMAGLGPTKDGLGQTKDAWAAIREETAAAKVETAAVGAEYQALGQIAQTAFQGLATALADGKIEGEELLQILLQIVQQMLSMPSLGGGGLGGGGGGLFGGFLIPGILHKGGVAGRDGYGHGRAVSPAVFAGARRYHSGGVAGLQPGEVPAILQRGELVVPRGGGGAQKGMHITVGVSADNNGNLMPFVESVSQKNAAAATRQGLSSYDKSLNRTLPGKMANAQARVF